MQFDDDIFDRTDAEYLILDIDGILVPFFMEEYRFRNDSVCLVKFCDIDTQQRAQELTGCDVFFPRSMAAESEDGLSLSSLIGYTLLSSPTVLDGAAVGTPSDSIVSNGSPVGTPSDPIVSNGSAVGTPSDSIVSNGSPVGTIAAIDATTANILFELEDGMLIPASAELITAIDHMRHTITMQLPDGILEL